MQSVLNLNPVSQHLIPVDVIPAFCNGEFWVGLQLTFLLSLICVTIAEVWSWGESVMAVMSVIQAVWQLLPFCAYYCLLPTALEGRGFPKTLFHSEHVWKDNFPFLIVPLWDNLKGSQFPPPLEKRHKATCGLIFSGLVVTLKIRRNSLFHLDCPRDWQVGSRQQALLHMPYIFVQDGCEHVLNGFIVGREYLAKITENLCQKYD